MDPATLTAIVQAIVTILTTLSGVWAIFSKQNADLDKKLSARFDDLEQQVKLSNNLLNKRIQPVITETKHHM
jgi:uncharacterized membrane protein YfbV (UPF0208 family)